jgi:predicted AAA+ superfamily ATPase
MEIGVIKRIIQDQEEERERILSQPDIIERDADKMALTRALKYPNVFTVLGIRRSGKSTLIWLLLRGRAYAYINFDDEALYGMGSQDLNVVLKAFYELYGEDLEYMVLDEIQNVAGWELFVNRLSRNKRVVITGSNSALLSGELATHLTGRHSDFLLFPFSFAEYLKYRKFDISKAKQRQFSTETASRMSRALSDYIKNGGMPEGYKFGKERIKATFSDIVFKDVIRRHGIRNTAAVETLARYLVSNFAKEITYSGLCGAIGVGRVATVSTYVGYLQEAYLIFQLPRFSFKLRKYAIAPKKVYCTDTSFINAVAFSTSDNTGRLMENVVATELLRRRSYLGNDAEVFYWKDYYGREVDFVIKKGKKVEELVQVTYASSKNEINDRETKALLYGSKDLRCSNLLIITWDYEGMISAGRKKIRCMPLWKWLLG